MKPLPFGGDDMFVIVVYDVNQKRCNKMRKYLAQWLEHRQRSVFAGFLTRAQVKIMRQGLEKITNPRYDSLIIFSTPSGNKVHEWVNEFARHAHIQSMITDPFIPETENGNEEEENSREDAAPGKPKRGPKGNKKKKRFRR